MELVRVNEMLPDVEAIECSLADAEVSGQTLYFTVIENAFRTRATPLPSMLPPPRTIHLIRNVSPILALPALSRQVTHQRSHISERAQRHDR